MRGGTSNPYTLRKNLRAQEIAMTNRLPAIGFVESGGADLPRQKEIFVPGGANFRNLTRKSAAGIPTVAIVTGNATAGGAYQPGMSDYTVMVREQGLVFLGGPPLVKMATGEEAEEEALGGAEMHSRVSGVSEFMAADEADAARIGREIIRNLNWRKRGPEPRGEGADPVHDPEELLGIASHDLKIPFDAREVIARVVDGSRFDEFKPAYGTQLVTGWAELHGWPIAILANNGVIFNEDAEKAAHFIQLADQVDTPLLFLQNTTGYIVGERVRAARHRQGRREDDQRGRQRRRAEADADDRRLLRRRQLRDVRPQLRAAVHLQLAEPQDRGDGTEAARRGDGDRHARRRRAARDRGRRGGAWRRARRRSRSRSSASRTPSSPAASSGTTASSTRATPARCSGSPSRRPSRARSQGSRRFGVFRM